MRHVSKVMALHMLNFILVLEKLYKQENKQSKMLTNKFKKALKVLTPKIGTKAKASYYTYALRKFCCTMDFES